jgi:hypothetical protein
MDTYAAFEWIENTPLGSAIKDSTWLFPGIEAAHLLALAMLGGAVLMTDLRLLGVGLSGQPVSVVERGARPWLIAALATLVVTGSLIGVSEAIKLHDKPAFWVKMSALAAALAFTFAVKIPLAARDVRGLLAPMLALVSIALWLTVAMAGRWIGFS